MENNEKIISTLKPLVAQMARELVVVMKEKHGIDLEITSGYRSPAQQDAIYAQGRTTPGAIVTQAKGGQSFHNFGVAFDCVPLIGGKPEWSSAYTTTALEASIIGLEHGDRGYVDLPHFECRLGYSLEDFQDGKVDWSKYEVLQNNQNKHMDTTPTTPKTVIVKKIMVTFDVVQEGTVLTADNTEPLTVTPELIAALKLEDATLVEGGYNVEVVAA